MRRFAILSLLGLMLMVAGPAQGTIGYVFVYDTYYSPTNITVSHGDTVRWEIQYGIHQIVSDASSPKYFESFLLTSGQTFDVAFTEADGPGPFPYHDGYHPAITTLQDTVRIAPPTCWASGDPNGDGYNLTLADKITLERYIWGHSPWLPIPYEADLTGDCVLDNNDVAVFIDYFINGLSAFGDPPVYPVLTCCEMTPCCSGMRGNVDGDPEDQITVSDLVYLVEFMFSSGPPPICPQEGDIDGSCGSGVIAIDIADLIYLVDYMFNAGPPPAPCP